MVEYECFRCGYKAKQRVHMKNHLNRKRICKPIEDDVSIESIKEYYDFEITQISSNFTQKSSFYPQKTTYDDPQKSSLLQQNFLKNPQKSSKIFISNETNLKCEFCNKLCSRSDNLKRHLKTCKKRKETEQLLLLDEDKDKKIEELEKALQLEKEKVNTNIINNNNNSTNIHTTNNTNIIINNLGEENIAYLKSGKFAELLQGIYAAVPKLIQHIHFNPAHPENHNIKFPNKRMGRKIR